MGLREDDYPQRFLGFKLRVERIFSVTSHLFLSMILPGYQTSDIVSSSKFQFQFCHPIARSLIFVNYCEIFSWSIIVLSVSLFQHRHKINEINRSKQVM